MKTSLTQHLVNDTLVKVFQRHGAVKLSTPLLMPQQNLYKNLDHFACLMDDSGRLVGLPFDLRVSKHQISHYISIYIFPLYFFKAYIET